MLTVSMPLMIGLVLVAPVIAGSEEVSTAGNQPAELEEPVEETLALDAAELSKTLGIPVDLEMQYLQRQPLVSELHVRLSEAGPSSFGGLFVEYSPHYSVIVLAKPGREQQVQDSIKQAAPANILEFVDVRESNLTMQVLMEARATILEAVPGLVTDSSSDLVRGLVSIGTLSREDASELEKRIEDLSLPIPQSRVEIVAGPPTDLLDSYGGLRMDSPGAFCTAGFSVSQIGGGPDGVASAAHCKNDATLWGTEQLEHVDGLWGGFHDVQWFKTPGMPDDNKVRDNSSDSTRPITGRVGYGSIFNGMHLCKFGAQTGYGCGQVIDPTYQPGCSSGRCFFETFVLTSFATTNGGDSGGPWFVGQDAVGIHKGKRNNGDDYFMPQSFMHELVSPTLGIRPKGNP